MSNKKAFIELTPPRWGITMEIFRYASIECSFCSGHGMIENQEEHVTCPVCRGCGQLDAVVKVLWQPSKIAEK